MSSRWVADVARGSAVRETWGSLALVFRNPGLRKVNLALAGSLIGDWAYATAVTVWAYGVGGVTAVGVWTVVRLVLISLITPFAGVLADRFERKRVMVGADVVRAVLVLAAAGCVFWEAPHATVYVLATLASVAGSPFRPAQGALLPSLAESPKELTSANGTASTLESLAFFVGPAIGGLLLTVADVPAVFALQAATFLWSALLVSSIRVPHPADAEPEGASEGVGAEAEEATSGFLAESVAGFRTIWNVPDLRMVSGIYCAQTVVAGASAVFGVAIAVQLTNFGPKGVGYLDAMLGVGAVVGGLVAIGRAGKFRLASDFGWGVIFWALPLLLISAWPTAAAAFLAMLVIGAANPVVDVNASTILQRLAPDEVLGRVFAALESALIGTMALGALIMPVLIHLWGLQWGLAVLGVLVALSVVPALPRLRRLDLSLTPPAGLALLQQLDLFAPLEPQVLEDLAGNLVEVRAVAGEVVLNEGEAGALFYVIESGAVRVTADGRELRTQRAGEFFGEIALLRDVPRTASVTATEDCVFQTLSREHFLAAMEGDSEVRTRVEDVVNLRLPV